MFDYTIDDINETLKDVGVKKNDIIYCHSNIAFFGKLKNINNNKKLVKKFFDVLSSRVGFNGLLIFPTYTYSFSKKKKEIFNLHKTKSNMGALSEYVRKMDISKRSMDPFFSSVVVGNKTLDLIQNLPYNSFAKNSLFDRFYQMNGKILNFNFPGCTFIHYIERMLNVSYRFDKNFKGHIILNNKKKLINWKIFVRYLSSGKYIHNPYPLVDYLKKKNISNVKKLGRGEVFLCDSRKIFNTIKTRIKKDSLFLTMGNKHD